MIGGVKEVSARVVSSGGHWTVWTMWLSPSIVSPSPPPTAPVPRELTPVNTPYTGDPAADI